MQLKLRRSQRTGGVISKGVIFCLDARVEFVPDEKQSIARYKLQGEVLYNSEAQRRLLDKSAAQQDGSISGSLKSLATTALAATKLNITIGSLERGQHIECKSLEELIAAEEALLAACQNLKAYLDTALTFDGREVLVDFATGAPAVIAHAVTPQPMLAAPRTDPAPVAPAISYQAVEASDAPYPTETLDWDMEALGRQTRDFFGSMFDEPIKRVAAIAVGVFLLFLLLRSCAG